MSEPSHFQRGYALRLSQPDFWNKPDPAADAQWAPLAAMSPDPTGKDPFWLLDGPPYANGELHLGHVLNKSLKDAFARVARAKGRSVVWRAGWDCHGLPLELAAQKRKGSPDRRAPAFLSACRQEAQHWMGRQSATFARLGVSANLASPWTTMDPPREARALRLLRELWDEGLLVERHSPTHWCPACQSALAASELEKAPSAKESLHAWAPLTAASARALLLALGRRDDEAVGVAYWTTTPWTLPANQAYAFAEDSETALVRLPDRRLCLCSAAAASALGAALGAPALDVEARLGAPLLDALRLQALAPLGDREVPVRAAAFASSSEGTGFVHVAPAFGPEDFDWAESNPALGLSLACPMGPDGRYGPLAPGYEGLDRAEAGARALAALANARSVLAHKREAGEANACWRHGSLVFYRASRQWALDLDKPFSGQPLGLRERARKALDEVRFLPNDKPRNALAKMLDGRRFWTLSRDRHWGLPLPLLRQEDGSVSPATPRWWDAAVEAVSRGGLEAYAAMAAPPGLAKENQCVDVWFDSGAAFETAAEPGLPRPSLVVEGADQTRGWFLSSMLLSAFRSERPAFSTLACHGFVVDERGRKLSKSLGNAPDTQKLLDEHGADVLRLWSLSQTMGSEVVWSKKALEQAKVELRDWRNFLRFLLAHRQEESSAAPSTGLEHLAVAKLSGATQGWVDGFERGQPHVALAALREFRRWASSSWFELSKRALYCQADGDDLRSRRAMLSWTLSAVLPLLDPFMPLATAQARASAGWSPLSASALPHPLAWSASKATEAEAALAWREQGHAEQAAARSALGDPKAKLVFGGGFAETAAKALGVEAAHLARGACYGGESHQWTLAPKAWECPRCRGLFPTQTEALGERGESVALWAEETFGHQLCAACCQDEGASPELGAAPPWRA